MTRVALLAAALLVALTSFFALPAAAEVAGADRTAMQALVDGQIAAFRRDDDAAAYSYASPMIQTLYPNPGIFMQMVRQAYQPVYRPQQYTFGSVVETAAGPKMNVYVTGPDGQGYVAEYSFQRQADGTWKINGCRLIKDTSPTI